MKKQYFYFYWSNILLYLSVLLLKYLFCVLCPPLLTGQVEDQQQVTILRDTGGSRSFILSSVLPLDAKSACDVSTVVRGIGMCYVPAPLHRIHVQSKLVSGWFPVAVRSCFPVDGVHFIMGNDIAGGKVYPDPEVVDVPISENEPD